MRTTQQGARWRMTLATAMAAATMLVGSAAPALADIKVPTGFGVVTVNLGPGSPEPDEPTAPSTNKPSRKITPLPRKITAQ